MTTINSVIINLIVVIVLLPLKGLAQDLRNGKQDKINLQSTDAYLIKMHVDSIYSEEKYKFSSVFGNQMYKICKIKVEDIYYMGDSTYVTYKELMNADFLLYKDKTAISHDTTINVSLFGSSMKNVYFMGRFLSEDELLASKYYYHAVVTNVDIYKKKLFKFLSENR